MAGTDKMLKTAVRAAKEAGRIQLSHFRRSRIVKKKNRYDVLNEVDLKCEKKILGMIKKEFPGHEVLSEEKGLIKKESEYRWVVDPLDGTANYTVGIPLFGVSIAVTKDHKPVVGVIYLPCYNEMFTAVKGEGSRLNGKKIKVSGRSLADSVVHFFTTSRKKYRKDITKIMDKSIMRIWTFRAFGSSAVNLAYIACGRADGSVKNSFHWWDIAAGILLIEEAGGKVTDMKGKRLGYGSGSMLATNGRIHRRLVEILS